MYDPISTSAELFDGGLTSEDLTVHPAFDGDLISQDGPESDPDGDGDGDAGNDDLPTQILFEILILEIPTLHTFGLVLLALLWSVVAIRRMGGSSA